jgi:hypothetical protein
MKDISSKLHLKQLELRRAGAAAGAGAAAVAGAAAGGAVQESGPSDRRRGGVLRILRKQERMKRLFGGAQMLGWSVKQGRDKR